MGRLEVVLDYFMDFNLDPDKNQKRVEYTAKKVVDYEPSIIKKACGFYAGEDNRMRMPNVPVLVKKCKEFEIGTNEDTYEECDICDGEGCFLSVFNVREDSRIEVVSYDHETHEGDRYYTAVIGKCKCSNGKVYGSRLPVTEPPSFMRINEPVSINFEASRLCTSLNLKSRELDNE